MADRRGGYQKPKHPAAVSGPGKFSRRTDGGPDTPKTPGIQGTDLQYGDVQQLEAGQSIAPLPKPQVAPQASAAQRVAPVSRERLPDFVTNGESNRPAEPGTHGLSTGLGAGPEILPTPPATPAEQALTRIWQLFGNPQALAMLNKLRNETYQFQNGGAAQAPPPPPGMGAPAPEVPAAPAP